MSEKVALPREVAEAIEELRSIGISSYTIISELGHIQSLGKSGLTPHLKVIRAWINEGNGNTLLSALVNGYEIERTPHEELRDYYEKCRREYFNASSVGDKPQRREQLGKTVAIKETLQILGITVEGINDTNTSTDAT